MYDFREKTATWEEDVPILLHEPLHAVAHLTRIVVDHEPNKDIF
jgi:hypothetical protein